MFQFVKKKQKLTNTEKGKKQGKIVKLSGYCEHLVKRNRKCKNDCIAFNFTVKIM